MVRYLSIYVYVMITLANMRRVAVGSMNPVKIQAVKIVLEHYLDHEIDIVGMDAPSRVSDMPLNEDEILNWSYNRAQRCMTEWEFDLAIGLEWWVDYMYDVIEQPRCYLTWCVTILDREMYVNTGWGIKFVLPPSLADALADGWELGTYMDLLAKSTNTKQKGWAMWYFTQGYIPRDVSFSHAMIAALVPWLHSDLYLSA